MTLKGLLKHFNGLLSNRTTGQYPEHKNIAKINISTFLSQLGSLITLTPAFNALKQLTGLDLALDALNQTEP